MSEDFRKFNNEMMQKEAPVVDNNAEQLPPPPAEINVDIPEQKEPISAKPELKTNPNGTYKGFFLAPVNHLQRITDALNKMAETDQELAIAIAVGKKTFEGCDRYIRNNMADLAREMGQREITFDDDTIHFIARYYMVNPDNLDVQNVAKAVKEEKEAKPKAEKKPKKEPKPKAEKKPKAEPKPKAEKKPKVVPLTPAIGNLFGDDDF